MSFDVAALRAEFPALAQTVHGKRLAYLDSGATTLKPRAVLAALEQAYALDMANVHRGVHELARRATEAFEGARARTARFLGAVDPATVVFTRGTTEALNLVARGWAAPRLGEDDEIVLAELEHHANLVPWQMVAEQTGARLVWVPVGEDGLVPPEAYLERIGPRTKVVALAHVSNVLGTVLPVAAVTKAARAAGAISVVDGAQAVPHVPVDVGALGCDFYAFSAHKLYGPTGIGVLWGRPERLEQVVPQQGGGDMILTVEKERSRFKGVPHRLEAGTPHIAGAVGLRAAIDWYTSLDLPALHAHEARLLAEASAGLEALGCRIIGRAPGKVAALSFVLEDVHPHDLATILDREGVATRGGHHCAEPLMEVLDLDGTARASFGAYNDDADVAALLRGVERAKALFA
ncbi:MAG: SufS family cysteine desulfurase [Myxococcota bacterium]